MAKAAPNAFFDAAFAWLDDSTSMIACSAQPTTFTEATVTFALADVAMTAGTDYTIADGDTSGRKVTVAAKNGVNVDTSGDATHIALVTTADSTLRYVTTCAQQTLTAGNTVNFPSWSIEIADPS